MALTLDQMRALIRKNIGDRLSSNTIITQDDYLAYCINDMTVPDLVGRHDWTWKYSVQTGQIDANQYVMRYPNTIQDIAVVLYLTGNLTTTKKLDFKTPLKFFEDYPDPSLFPQWMPSYYTKIKRDLWFNCPIDVATNIRLIGYTKFAKLSLPTESPDWLDEDRHMVLVYGATGMAFLAIEDKTNSQPWLNLYESTVKQMWEQDQAVEAELITAGAFKPGDSPDMRVMGEYWKSPFILRSPE